MNYKGLSLALSYIVRLVGAASMLGAFAWSSAAVLTQTSSRDLELLALLFLGTVNVVVILSTVFLLVYMNWMLKRGEQVVRLEYPLPSLNKL